MLLFFSEIQKTHLNTFSGQNVEVLMLNISVQEVIAWIQDVNWSDRTKLHRQDVSAFLKYTGERNTSNFDKYQNSCSGFESKTLTFLKFEF
jgi:hypothetical protein